MRENCPFWLRRNGQTMGSDNWFGICLWQSLNNLSGHLSNTQRHWMTIENLILDGQVHPMFSENKIMSKLHCQRWRCLLPSILKLFEDFFACKLNCLKQSLIWCHFHSTRMTIEEFLYPTHCLLKVCFWGYVHLRHSYGRIRHGFSNNDSWLKDIKNRKFRAKFYRI